MAPKNVPTRVHRSRGPELRRKQEEFVAERMRVWDEANESDHWSWHILFQYCAMNPILRRRLDPLPWSHSKVEAAAFCEHILSKRTDPVCANVEARLLRMYLAVQRSPWQLQGSCESEGDLQPGFGEELGGQRERVGWRQGYARIGWPFYVRV